MTGQPAQSQPQTSPEQSSDKSREANFRQQEAMYKKALDQERAARLEAERISEEAKRSKMNDNDDDDDSEPYINHKKLNKTLNKFGQNTQSDIQKAMEMAKHAAKEELKQEMWLENNPDFYDTLKHAEAFAQKAPKLAETILRMPEGFERQKLVYQNIKALEIDKPAKLESSIQHKIDANKRSPYYQPSGTGSAPYAGGQSDFSPSGQKAAYEKMTELKNRLRLG